MHVLSVVGARPQFIKLAVICRALALRKDSQNWRHTIIHTGQHYDNELSSAFFDELAIPKPSRNLGVGSGSHAFQTGEMLKELETVLEAERPDWVLLYGDTNSTLAGALAGAKASLKIAHIESGLRSRRRGMPEEINRIVADHLSDLLFCPTALAMTNLQQEGLGERAVLTGDVMLDACLAFRRMAELRAEKLAEPWQPRRFALATVHRAENTDDPKRLAAIARALNKVAETTCPVVWPIHPRTAKRLDDFRIRIGSLTAIRPVSYLGMLLLESRARFILTDSGGVQKEAYFLKVPCITLREETEWEETLQDHCNTIVGCCESKIMEAVQLSSAAGPWRSVYGDGGAGIAMLNSLQKRK